MYCSENRLKLTVNDISKKKMIQDPLLSNKRLFTPFFPAKPLLLFLCFSIFYLLTANVRPIGIPDEARYTSVAYQMYLNKDYINPLLNNVLFMDKPILYYWLEVFSMHLFGVNNLALRIPPLMLSLVSMMAVYITAHRFFNAAAAWLATAILGTSPLWFIFSQYTNLDIEVAAWLTLTLTTSLIALHTPFSKKKRLLFYLAYIFAAAATLTKGLMGIVFPIMIIGMYSLLTHQWKLIKEIYLPSGLIVYSVIALPWFILMHNRHPEFLYYFFIYQHFFRYLSIKNFNCIQPFWFFSAVILLGLIPWSLLIIQSFFKKQQLKALCKEISQKNNILLYLLLWIAVPLIFFSLPASKPPGYILPVFAPLCLLIGSYLSGWIQYEKKANWLKYGLISLTLLTGLLLLLAAIADFHFIHKLNKIKIWLFISAASGCVCSVIALICKKRARVIMCLLIFPTVLCLCLPFMMKKIDRRSLQPLLTIVAPFITPQTLIVNYDKYFYDMPLLLKRKEPIITVSGWNNEKKIMSSDNWRRELYSGIKNTPASKEWLLDYDEFDRLLKTTHRPVIVFAKNHSKNLLINEKKLHLIAELNNNIVVSSKTY